MQNNKHSGSFGKLLRDKGYYIVLFLCAAAVGISGYLYLANHSKAPSEPPAAETEPQSGAAAPRQESSPGRGQQASVPETPEDVPASAAADPASADPEPAGFSMVMPVNGELVQGYAMDHLSYNPTTQDWRVHDGIDIAAQTGTDVLAAADGTVAAIYEDDALGTTVCLSHPNGYTTVYANLDADVAVHAGDSVQQGERLGSVGSSALMESGQTSHLHFALSCSTVSLDPERYFS